MDEEHREAIRKANRNRGNCPKCGGTNNRIVDGSECNGLPGINYRECTQCGNARAITKRPPRRHKL